MAIPLAYPVRSLLVRKWTSVFTAGGVALVVTATLLLLALVGGIRHMLASSGEADNVVVLRKGATTDGVSQVTRDGALALRTMAGVARGPDGQPLVSPEIVNQPFLITQGGGREIVLIRGVEPAAFLVHRAVRLTAGRMFRPHVGEVVVGVGVRGRYRGATLGDEIEFGRRRWTVVGILDSGGKAFDSEIWADVADVQDDTRRTGYSGVRLTLAPGTDFATLKQRIEHDGRFTLEAKLEADYYREQAETTQSLYVLVLALAAIMGTGAVFGALNTMYAAVAGRTAEIGTLRALGFARGAILRSFLGESLVLAGAGLAAGTALAALAVFAVNTLLSGVQFSMMTFSVATVLLHITPGSLLVALAIALGIGLLGGLAPAWRAARLRVVDALHRA